jgi:class II lanthipeptide synthase
MSPIHPDLLATLDAVEIQSPNDYSIGGEARHCPGPTSEAAVLEPGSPPRVVALGNELYGSLYLKRSAPDTTAPSDHLARRDWVASLSAANNGRGTWEPGWKIRRIDDDGRVVVVKADVTFWVERAGLRFPGESPMPGLPCRVRIGKEMQSLMPGFYIALGDSEGDADDEGDEVEPLVRYYWHLKPVAAVRFLAAATEVLNEVEVPFRIKVLSDPDAYLRADAGVLYLRRRYHGRIGDAIARIHQRIAPGLRPATPMFTKRLAEGLGLAEDPTGGSSSFGQHRCLLIARGLWRSFDSGDADRHARQATLADEFQKAGYDPQHPFLEPGSIDIYDWRPIAEADLPRSAVPFPVTGRRA